MRASVRHAVWIRANNRVYYPHRNPFCAGSEDQLHIIPARWGDSRLVNLVRLPPKNGLVYSDYTHTTHNRVRFCLSQ